MPSIDNVVGLLGKLESADITVRQERCVVVRNRNAKCRKCAEACTSGAIAYLENELVITPEKCIGCGTCATVCPTCALEAHHPNDAELLKRCLAAAEAAEGEVVIACEQIYQAAAGLYDPAKVVSLPCLGRVEESLLTTLAARGITQVRLVTGDCADCDHATGYDTLQLVMDTERTLLDTWGGNMAVEASSTFPRSVRKQQEDEYDHDKREFFTDMKGEAASAAVVTVDYAAKEAMGMDQAEEAGPRIVRVMDDGTLPHFVPDRRDVLLSALSQLGEPADDLIETRLWGHVIIDRDTCSSCRMCATFCPTGAIFKFDDDADTFGVEHFPGDCVKCRCCEDICPTKALTLSEEVFARDIMEGRTERYEMDPMTSTGEGPHSIVNSMRNLIGMDQIYER